jgi:hypothetical protein
VAVRNSDGSSTAATSLPTPTTPSAVIESAYAARCCGDAGNEDRAGDSRSETRAEIGHAAHRTGVERQVAAKTPPVRVVVVSVLTLASPANSPDRKLGHRTGASSDSSARLLVARTWDIGTDTRLRPANPGPIGVQVPVVRGPKGGQLNTDQRWLSSPSVTIRRLCLIRSSCPAGRAFDRRDRPAGQPFSVSAR